MVRFFSSSIEPDDQTRMRTYTTAFRFSRCANVRPLEVSTTLHHNHSVGMLCVLFL